MFLCIHSKTAEGGHSAREISHRLTQPNPAVLLRCQSNVATCQDTRCSRGYVLQTFKRKKVICVQQMAREDIAERINELARKYVELGRKYAETRDDKKIVEELYELVRELGKLKKELLH